MLRSPRYTVIADPASMRWEFYERDLRKFWQDRGQESLVHVVRWDELIDRDGDISSLQKWDEPSILRIESPARDFQVIRKLMQAGDRCEGRAPRDWNPPDGVEGWIASPRLMYLGLCQTLMGLDASTGSLLRPSASVDDICRACDKLGTADLLRDASLPTPDCFQTTKKAESVLKELRDNHQWDDAFIKLAYGSCASGIAVVKPRYYHPHAVTTVAKVNGKYHNTFRLQTISEQDVLDLLDFLTGEHAIA